MFFAHEQIVWALSQNLNDADTFEEVYLRLVLNTPHSISKGPQPDGRELFRRFLKQDLPPAEEADRIVKHLTQIADQFGMRLEKFFWWDILSRTRALYATQHHNDAQMGIYFYWKCTTDKALKSLSTGECSCGYTRDPTEPGGCSIKFEARTYQEVRLRYETWLKCPSIPPKNR